MAAWLTQKDVDDYGHDVLDLAQRAALHAMTPELQRIDHQNAELRQQLAAEQRRGLYQTLDAQLPNWKEIDNDPRWRQWLLFSDPLNGRPRQSLLNEAIAQGNATRVLSFFRGFLAEAGQSPQRQPPPQAGTLGGGGRTYTRAEINRLHAWRRNRITRSGGRLPAEEEAAWARQEADIVAAAREGRISDPPISKGKAPYG
jgi:hypothetical protein